MIAKLLQRKRKQKTYPDVGAAALAIHGNCWVYAMVIVYIIVPSIHFLSTQCSWCCVIQDFMGCYDTCPSL